SSTSASGSQSDGAGHSTDFLSNVDMSPSGDSQIKVSAHASGALVFAEGYTWDAIRLDGLTGSDPVTVGLGINANATISGDVRNAGTYTEIEAYTQNSGWTFDYSFGTLSKGHPNANPYAELQMQVNPSSPWIYLYTGIYTNWFTSGSFDATGQV